jgi:RNA polymerase sigma factor (sigma-70 family)
MKESIQGEGDRYLVDEIRSGSSEAFRRLVDRFGGRLKAFAARRLQGSGIDPEDAVQETFLSLLRSIDRLEGVRSLQAYLFTILRRRIVDLCRARGPATAQLHLEANGASSSSGNEPASPESTPSTYVRREEAIGARVTILADILDSLLSRLKSERKFRDLKVLELLFSCGLSQGEAARKTGTSEPTVSRVRAALVEELRGLITGHPQKDALEDLPEAEKRELPVAALWRENLFSCLKRSTLGSYALGVLDEEWTDYVRFHLETAGCEYCAAHLADINAEAGGISPSARERIFASSAGFLRQ